MQDSIPFRLIIPEHMRTVRDLLNEAGWHVVFDVGIPEPTHQESNELNRGYLRGPIEGEVLQTRSMDMFDNLNDGRYDVIIVGSDCIEERPNPHYVRVAEFALGRQWDAPKPRLELVALRNSSAEKPQDINPGSIVMTERPRVTRAYLESFGHQIVNLGRDIDPETRQRLRETGSIGLREILGDGPAQLDKYSPDDFFLAIVSESGTTVRHYELRELGLIHDIDTILLTRDDVWEDSVKGEIVRTLARDLNENYPRVKKERESTMRSKER